MATSVDFRGLRAVSIQFMWPEHPFPERVRLAREAGFNAIEMWDWRDKEIDRIAEAAHRHGVQITGFFGNRLGSLVDAAEHGRNLQSLRESLEVARRTGTRVIHAFTNEIRPGGVVAPLTRAIPPEEQWANCVEGLQQAAALAAEYEVVLLLEAINPVFVPGYLLDDADKCRRMVEEVGSPWMPMIFDFYHQQLSRGNLLESFRRCAEVVKAVHIADVPGRHEPGTGEINYGNVSRALRQIGYDGLLTFEVVPSSSSSQAVEAIRAAFADWFPD